MVVQYFNLMKTVVRIKIFFVIWLMETFKFIVNSNNLLLDLNIFLNFNFLMKVKYPLRNSRCNRCNLK